MLNSLKRLAEKLDRRRVGIFFLGDRNKWVKSENDFLNAIAFLREMDRIADDINSRYESDIGLYLDQEDEEWWLQARFNSRELSQEEVLQRVEKNVKGLLEALKEYHKRIEALDL